MKAITIKQPWASLIVHGIKDIENRTWACPKKYIGQRVFFEREKECGFHTITEIDCYGHVTFDGGEAIMFRPEIQIINIKGEGD